MLSDGELKLAIGSGLPRSAPVWETCIACIIVYTFIAFHIWYMHACAYMLDVAYVVWLQARLQSGLSGLSAWRGSCLQKTQKESKLIL